ncbi:beta-ketoacyl-ACP synthase III [Lactiplantibacillus fabifermentans]|uniref:Beta-ketoacyl-[acyl-carrier-protein] synthase III n=2 Tax=Lactiplantibacillus fabifermentans TaxID=483011 RepID=A0A0R2NTP0_9LACO|nr:beta-ketoacyl-ACP synthase III [Lactiplantibacillus fabifermentans]ETY74404.1 3-oxoacyl-ACP synthase [Lactiplantibacillus fabifermentans T30PCM01]KRO28242.1 fabH2 protein [Lactiplantibacillus fabifermentans DSM 21115]
MTTDHFTIVAAAQAVPQHVVTNQALTDLMPTSDEWIRQRTGIQTRHVATTETTTSLCVSVGQQLLAQTDVRADQIDLIVVATMSPDYLTPATATQVQAALRATNAVAFDINVACAGFVFGMELVHRYLQSGQTALLIGGETLSRLVDWHDRRTAVLFGDGAGGVLIQNQPDSSSGWLGQHFASFGEQGRYLTAGQFQQKTPWQSASASPQWAFQMDGRRVYNFATKQVPQSLQAALASAQLAPSDIDLYILHQANARIIASVGRKLKLTAAQLPMNIAKYGNTAAASEPILLAELVASGQLKRGMRLAFAGFGGGLSVGTAIINY